MAMELKGKIIQILPPQTGMGKKGQWKKQEFIIETQAAQYPKKVCLIAWGDKIDSFNLTAGETVNVHVDLESREYNGRWYTEARAWKVEKSAGAAPSAPPVGEEPFEAATSGASDDLPF